MPVSADVANRLLKFVLAATCLLSQAEALAFQTSRYTESRQATKELQVENCHIFALWSYKGTAPSYIIKNLESWRLNSGSRCGQVVLVNESNVKHWIPDLPDEFYRLPDHASQSDLVRYALVYHNGGMYMDTDFLVVKDMSPILDRMNNYDLMSYTVSGQSCETGSFSSNFVAGRKGSAFHKAVWDAQKQALSSRCSVDAAELKQSVLCCHEKGNCKVPWASLGEGISHKVLRSLLQTSAVKYYCFDEQRGEGFAPDGLGIVLSGHRRLNDAVEFFDAYHTRKPLERMMYHLFNSQGFARRYGGDSLFDASLFVGHLYRLSGVSPNPEFRLGGPTALCAEMGTHCLCNGTAMYGRMYPDAGMTGEPRSLDVLLQSDYFFRKVNGKIRCADSEFGGDPVIGIQKMCMCHQH